jgi:hypothetical protein
VRLRRVRKFEEISADGLTTGRGLSSLISHASTRSATKIACARSPSTLSRNGKTPVALEPWLCVQLLSGLQLLIESSCRRMI